MWFTALLGLTETFLASFSFSGSGKMWDARGGGGGGLPSLAEILRRPQAQSGIGRTRSYCRATWVGDCALRVGVADCCLMSLSSATLAQMHGRATESQRAETRRAVGDGRRWKRVRVPLGSGGAGDRESKSGSLRRGGEAP